MILVRANSSYLAAVEACGRKNGILPSADTKDSIQDLVDQANANNVTNVWLRLYRQDLGKHQWSDKSVLGKTVISNVLF